MDTGTHGYSNCHSQRYIHYNSNCIVYSEPGSDSDIYRDTNSGVYSNSYIYSNFCAT